MVLSLTTDEIYCQGDAECRESKMLPPLSRVVVPITPFLSAFKTLPATGSHVASSYLLTYVSDTCFVGVQEKTAQSPTWSQESWGVS